MGDLNAGLLTLLSFLVLAVFGVVAFFSLRKHVRGIRAPHKPELPKEGAEFNDPYQAEVDARAGKPTPKPRPKG